MFVKFAHRSNANTCAANTIEASANYKINIDRGFQCSLLTFMFMKLNLKIDNLVDFSAECVNVNIVDGAHCDKQRECTKKEDLQQHCSDFK